MRATERDRETHYNIYIYIYIYIYILDQRCYTIKKSAQLYRSFLNKIK